MHPELTRPPQKRKYVMQEEEATRADHAKEDRVGSVGGDHVGSAVLGGERQEYPEDLVANTVVASRVPELQNNLSATKPICRDKIIDEDIEETKLATVKCEDFVHFCCHLCTCSPSKQGYGTLFQSSEYHFWHRCCCHNISKSSKDKRPHIDRLGDMSDFCEQLRKPKMPTMTEKQLQAFHNEVKSEESEYSDGSEDKIEGLNSDMEYCSHRNFFNQLSSRHRSAVVLDVFGGVGTAIVVLKRLGISMSKILHVENDKVATHVYRSHHDSLYNSAANNSNHSNTNSTSSDYQPPMYWHYETFEHVEANLDKIMEEHGPIDILLASPPDFGGSYGAKTKKGTSRSRKMTISYMTRISKLIQKINFHPIQDRKRNPLFFMVETAETEDLQLFNFRKLDLDASRFSPCRRLSSFYTNIPIDHVAVAKEDNSKLDPSTCFIIDEGTGDGLEYFLPAKILEGKIEKVDALKASYAGVEDQKMTIFARLPADQEGKQKYTKRCISATEHAVLMGFPLWYFQPVDELFQKIRDVLVRTTHNSGERLQCPENHWKKNLDSKYYHFRGSYHGASDAYRLQLDRDGTPFLLMSPRGKKTFLTSEQYKKQLLGNASSIPVLECILCPLKRLFPHKLDQCFQYLYQWEPATNKVAQHSEQVANHTENNNDSNSSNNVCIFGEDKNQDCPKYSDNDCPTEETSCWDATTSGRKITLTTSNSVHGTKTPKLEEHISQSENMELEVPLSSTSMGPQVVVFNFVPNPESISSALLFDNKCVLQKEEHKTECSNYHVHQEKYQHMHHKKQKSQLEECHQYHQLLQLQKIMARKSIPKPYECEV